MVDDINKFAISKLSQERGGQRMTGGEEVEEDDAILPFQLQRP